MKRLLVALIACVFVASAHAEFTASEKVEVKKVVDSAVLSAIAIESLGTRVRNDPTLDNRSAYGPALAQLRATTYGYLLIWRNLASIFDDHPTPPRPARADELTIAKKRMDEVITGLTQTLSMLGSVPDSSYAQGKVTSALALLNTFDWALPYAEPLPASWPRIIGPHGDYDGATASFGHGQEYFSKTVMRAIEVYRSEPIVMSLPAQNALGKLVQHYGKGWALMMRVAALDAGIGVDADEEKVVFDCAAGSGLRPCSFFRLLRAIEITFTNSPAPIFSGRNSQKGSTKDFGGVTAYLSELTYHLTNVNTAEAMRQLWGDRLSTAFNNVQDGWMAFDDYAQKSVVFRFEIPAPPGTAPAVSCDPVNAVTLDDGSMPAQCKPRLGPDTAIDSTATPPVVISTVPEGGIQPDTTIIVEEPAGTSVFEGRRVQ